MQFLPVQISPCWHEHNFLTGSHCWPVGHIFLIHVTALGPLPKVFASQSGINAAPAGKG